MCLLRVKPLKRASNKFMYHLQVLEKVDIFFFSSPPNLFAKQSSWLICVWKIEIYFSFYSAAVIFLGPFSCLVYLTADIHWLTSTFFFFTHRRTLHQPVFQSHKVEIWLFRLLLWMLFIHDFWELTFNSVCLFMSLSDLSGDTVCTNLKCDSWSHTEWLIWSCMICQFSIKEDWSCQSRALFV